MTGAISILENGEKYKVVLTLDAADYGQKSCEPMTGVILARMESDARLIVAASDLLEACKAAQGAIKGHSNNKEGSLMQLSIAWGMMEDAIYKAAGE